MAKKKISTTRKSILYIVSGVVLAIIIIGLVFVIARAIRGGDSGRVEYEDPSEVSEPTPGQKERWVNCMPPIEDERLREICKDPEKYGYKAAY